MQNVDAPARVLEPNRRQAGARSTERGLGWWARLIGRSVGALLGLTAVTTVGVACALSAPAWKGPVTDHFDGKTFSTPGVTDTHASFANFLKWQASRDRGPWRSSHDEPLGQPPPREVGAGQMRVTFIGHATTLIQLDGVNVLTDPIYSDRASPVTFAGPKRVRPPGIRFEELPRIDAVVVSHNHNDHLDLPTLRRINAAWPRARILVGLGNKAFLESKHIENVSEFDWWQSTEVRGVRVVSVPSQHFSNRGLLDTNATLWCGWALEGRGGRAYFAGDTGYGPHFKAAAERLGPFRLAVLPIGAYRPEWFMGPIHMAPVEAVQAALDLRATLALPMHYGTFQLTDDGETEPLEALARALAKTPAPFAPLGFGEGLDVPEAARR